MSHPSSELSQDLPGKAHCQVPQPRREDPEQRRGREGEAWGWGSEAGDKEPRQGGSGRPPCGRAPGRCGGLGTMTGTATGEDEGTGKGTGSSQGVARREAERQDVKSGDGDLRGVI